jgi:hypothetical protein
MIIEKYAIQFQNWVVKRAFWDLLHAFGHGPPSSAEGPCHSLGSLLLPEPVL